MIRLAKSTDAAGMLEIYAPYVLNTSITFETEPPSQPEFEHRINNYMESYPWLVYETQGVLAGYAYSSRYRERTGYQWSVECSVYIHEKHHRSGIGRALYEALFAILKKQGFRNVYAVINLPNPESVKFHELCGFTWFANYEQVGYKLGKWKTVGWGRLIINEFSYEPPAPVMFSDLDKDFLPGLFKEKSNLVRK
jgi:phosphinothricin acetyltransferase